MYVFLFVIYSFCFLSDLRQWLTDSTLTNLAPLRAVIVADPGHSNQWTFLVDQLFSFDKIFGT